MLPVKVLQKYYRLLRGFRPYLLFNEIQYLASESNAYRVCFCHVATNLGDFSEIGKNVATFILVVSKTVATFVLTKTQTIMRYLSLSVVVLVLFSCNSGAKSSTNASKLDTCVVAYNQNGQYTFNKAIVWTHSGRKFKSDSGLDAEIGTITQFALRLPTTKSDSIIDSTTHKLIRVKDSYSPTFLADSLSKYIHIIDTLHTH
jgi:hypothetical protein